VTILRRVRGALGTALTWAAAWFSLAFLFITAINVFRLGIFRQYVWYSLSIGLAWAAQMAAVGFVTGGAFSLYVATVLRGRQLEDLRPVRFAFAGSLVAVLVSLGWYGLLAGIYGVLPNLLWPVLLPAAMGGVASYGSIALAQRALPKARAAPGRLLSDTTEYLPPGSGQDTD
jgi:hypothetical protein